MALSHSLWVWGTGILNFWSSPANSSVQVWKPLVYTHSMIYFCIQLWTEQHILVEWWNENMCVPMGSSCCQRSSWSWSWIRNCCLPPQGETLSPKKRSILWPTWWEKQLQSDWDGLEEKGNRESKKYTPPAPLQHVARCLLNKRLKRWDRRGQSLVAHFLEKDAGTGWRILSIHQMLVQQVPLHSMLFAFLIKSLP